MLARAYFKTAFNHRSIVEGRSLYIGLDPYSLKSKDYTLLNSEYIDKIGVNHNFGHFVLIFSKDEK